MTKPAETMPVRCAIYTRKSTGENLDMDFNTLDAQREACEMYIGSQKSFGWEVVNKHYDDGGFSGASMTRPALQILIDDIEAGLIDCVVVYKVDRLSRSLLDFARLIELFDKNSVSFVSTTQQFNTSQSLGRLVLNILLSFAQFEREMISERTRDKMAAARRKGKWSGGPPVLGYRVDRQIRRLEVIPEEAEQVNTIFNMYLQLQSSKQVARRLNEMGWVTKKYVTQKNKEYGGAKWKASSVHFLLRNKLYLGKVTYKDAVYEGEHEAIVSDALFEQVRQRLEKKQCGRGEGRTRNYDNILKGLLRCRCGNYMYATKGRSHTGADYRYYVCKDRFENGPAACDHPRIAATEIEPIIVERVKQICTDPALRADVKTKLDQGKTELAEQLGAKLAKLQHRINGLSREARNMLGAIKDAETQSNTTVTARLSEIELEMDELRQHRARIELELHGLTESIGRMATVIGLLDSFDELWAAMMPEEQVDLLSLLIDRIDVDEPAGKLELRMHDLAAPFPSAGAQSGTES